MTSGAPDAVILMVGANAGLIGMSKEHLAIALALGVPVCVVISKVGMVKSASINKALIQSLLDRHDTSKCSRGDN
jgi:GTP-binding protein 1